MKKIVLGGALFASIFSFGQIRIRFKDTRFGLSVGGNYSAVRNAHRPSGKRIGFQAGALALIPADEDNQFYIQPEVQYYQSGETGYNKEEGGDKNTKYYNNYVGIPIYIKGYFSEAESEFFGLLGPRFNILVNQKDEAIPSAYPGYSKDQNGKAASLNFGISAGVGYSYKRKWEIALKYDLGLSNTYPNMYKVDGILKRRSEQAVSVTLSYIFD